MWWPVVRLQLAGSVAAVAVLAGCAAPIDAVVRTALRTPYEQAFYQPSTGDRHASALSRLEARLHALGVSVTYGPQNEGFGAVGMTSPDRKYVWLDERLEPNGRLEVLAHEAGHVLQPETLSGNESQAFAELVGATVCYRLGMDVRKASGRWLGAYKAGLDGALAHRLEIDRAVAILLGEIEP